MSQIPDNTNGPEQWAPPDPFKDTPVATNETLSPPATSNTADSSIFASLPAPSLADYDDDQEEPKKVSRRGRPRTERKVKDPKPPTQKKPRKSTSKVASNQELVTVVPVSTSFDLFEGSYQKVIRARIGIMALAGVFVLIAIVLVGVGLRAGSSNSANEAQYNSLVASTNSLLAKVGADTNYSTGGHEYLGSSLRADLAYRTPLITTAVGSALDTTEILGDIESLAPRGSGISITGVTIAPSAATTASTTTTTEQGATATPTTVPTATGTPLTISVIVTNYTSLSNFETQLERYPWLQGVTATLTGATPSLNASITASITSLPYPTPPVVTKVRSQTPPPPTTTIPGATTTLPDNTTTTGAP